MEYNLDENNGILEFLGGKSPEKIMSIGQRIAIKHYSVYEYAYAFVANIEKNYIKVKFRNGFIGLDFFPEDPLVLTFLNNDNIHIGSGEVLSVESLDPLTIEIKVNKIIKRNSLRKDERFFVSVACTIVSKDENDAVFGIVKNLSFTGFKINAKKELDKTASVRIDLNIDKYATLSCIGKVVRKSKLGLYFEYGIQIEEISKNNMLSLQHYINQLKQIKQ
jgi:hypothetical protein